MCPAEFKSLRIILGVVRGEDVPAKYNSLVLGDELADFPGVTIVVAAKLSQIVFGSRVSKPVFFRIQTPLVIGELREKPVL